MKILQSEMPYSKVSNLNAEKNVNFGFRPIRRINPFQSKDELVKNAGNIGETGETQGKLTGLKTKIKDMVSNTTSYITDNGISKIKTAVGAIAVAGLIYSGANYAMTSNVTDIAANNNIREENYENLFGVSSHVVKVYNALPGINDNPEEHTLIPSKFDYIREKELEMTEKLSDKNITLQDKAVALNQISALQKKKEEQNKVADVFADDDYVYFNLHLQNSEPTLYSIKAEDFKKLFDIKDGALKDNNELKFKWNTTKTELGIFGFMDYADTELIDGHTYKVKKSDINTDKINLEDFME